MWVVEHRLPARESLRHHLQQGGACVLQARLAEEAQHRLSAEKTALIGTIRKLNRDVAKLEVTGQAAEPWSCLEPAAWPACSHVPFLLACCRGFSALWLSCMGLGEVQHLGRPRTLAIMHCSCWACLNWWHAKHLGTVAACSC